MSYELNGKVIHLGTADQKSDKLTIREMVVETSRQYNDRTYTEQIPVQFKNASIEKIEKVKLGDTVKVRFDIGGREYNGRYFCSINGFGCDVVGEGVPNVPSVPAALNNVSDDLPF
jgi:hypothetical protein